MAWGSDTAATQLTSITTEQFFNQVPALNPRETAHVQVSVYFPGSPTDHAIIAVYSTLDDSSEVWDLIPMMEFLIENTTDPESHQLPGDGRLQVPGRGAQVRVHRYDHQRRPEPPQGRHQRLAMACSASGRGRPSGRSSPGPWTPGSAGSGTPARG
jgi:hypothetical protein